MNTNIEVMNTVWMTQVGYQNLLAKIAEKEKEYEQVRGHRQVAFELSGDGWHDNPEFNRMQQLEANINHQIKELTVRIEQVRLIDIHDGMRPTTTVGIGSIIKIARWIGDEPQHETWELRGYDETDVNEQVLGYNTPLAQWIMHAKAGDYIEDVSMGGQVFDIEVMTLYRSRQEAQLA